MLTNSPLAHEFVFMVEFDPSSEQIVRIVP
jgi:hypothetical protein